MLNLVALPTLYRGGVELGLTDVISDSGTFHTQVSRRSDFISAT